MRLPVLLAALVVLAGCSDAPAADDTGTQTATSTLSGNLSGGNGTASVPVPMSLPVELDGNLGSFVHYCAFPAGQCDTHVVTPDDSDVILEHAGANFTGLDVNLTWTSSSPATDELALGFMVMATCEGCSRRRRRPSRTP